MDHTHGRARIQVAERTVHLASLPLQFHARRCSIVLSSLARQQVTCTARLPAVFVLRAARRLQRSPSLVHLQPPTAYALLSSLLSPVCPLVPLRLTRVASPLFALPSLSLPEFPLSLPLPPYPSPPCTPSLLLPLPYPKHTAPHPLSAGAQLRLPPSRGPSPIPPPHCVPCPGSPRAPIDPRC